MEQMCIRDRARAFNYRPKARLTARQEAVMETLIGCRSDLLNYTSALRGMAPEKRDVYKRQR